MADRRVPAASTSSGDGGRRAATSTVQASPLTVEPADLAPGRLLTILPITPGGLGITELGLVAILAAGASRRVTAPRMAARACAHPQQPGQC
jgi:hypothetical protein